MCCFSKGSLSRSSLAGQSFYRNSVIHDGWFERNETAIMQFPWILLMSDSSLYTGLIWVRTKTQARSDRGAANSDRDHQETSSHVSKQDIQLIITTKPFSPVFSPWSSQLWLTSALSITRWKYLSSIFTMFRGNWTSFWTGQHKAVTAAVRWKLYGT